MKVSSTYRPQNQILPQGNLSAAAPYTFSAKEKDSETGLSYFGSRYYTSDLSVWLSVDPMSDKYPSLSPYVYCANNPIKLVDPNGREISTHTDETGRVVAVFDDGDNGVYMHGVNADGSSVTEYQITKRHERKGPSAGGTRMGESLHSLSFADQNLYNKTGQIRPQDGMVINFESKELTRVANSIMRESPSLLKYQKKAATGGDWDIKAHYSQGSLLYGKYASPRDAGNFVAGMVAASNGLFLESMSQLGYGAYNLAGNNKLQTAFIILGISTLCAENPSEGLRLFDHVMNGEDILTQRCINLGIAYQHSKKQTK